jgi:hypothetical protein
MDPIYILIMKDDSGDIEVFDAMPKFLHQIEGSWELRIASINGGDSRVIRRSVKG